MYPSSMWHTNISTLDMNAAFRAIRTTNSSTNSISPEKSSLFSAAHSAFSVNTLLNQTSPDHTRSSLNNTTALAHHHQLFSSLFPHYPYPNPFRSLVNGNNSVGLLTSSSNSNSPLSSTSSAFLPTTKRFKRNFDDEILPIEKSNVDMVKNLSENRCRLSNVDIQNPKCPICHVTLNPQDLLLHVQQELNSLERQTCEKNRQHMKTFTSQTVCQKILHENPINNVDQTFKTRYETYIRVRTSRQQRLNAKFQYHQQRRSNRLESRYCPICFQTISSHADEEYFFTHVQQCSRKREQLAANVALATVNNQQRNLNSTPSVGISTSESSIDDPDVNVVDMDENDEHEDNQNDQRSTNETNSTTDQSDDRCHDDSSNSDHKSGQYSPSAEQTNLIYSSSNGNELNPPKCVACM